MRTYISQGNGDKLFKKKPSNLKRLINEAIFVIDSFGIPIKGMTPRRLERMALCFLALADVKSVKDWKKTRDISSGISMRSRDIIKYINKDLHDRISMGSYDDIRRKDIKLLVLGGIVVRTKPSSARNDPARGYAISKEHANVIKRFGERNWESTVGAFLKGRTTLADKLSDEREIPITVSPGKTVRFSPGVHNVLQKAIVEEFLPRFGCGAEVLYVGDTANKMLYKNESALKELDFFELSHGELPDVVAYSREKNWLFLIEAVHASGPISKTRKVELEELTEHCKADIIFVTAFLDKLVFRRFISEIAWETEVWIAETPDHLIHFNGDKFMGPYKK